MLVIFFVCGVFSPRRSDAAVKDVDLLIVGGQVVTINGQGVIYPNGYVAIRNDRILEVGDAAHLKSRNFRAASIIRADNKAVLPGLINAHTHIPMTLLRGLGGDVDLQEWLTRYIFPAEAKNVTRDYVIAGTRLGLVEMIRGGTTTYADMYYFEDTIASETKRAGVRAILGETVIDFPAPDNKTWDEAIGFTEKFLRQWKGGSLITPAIAPHAPYTVSTSHLEEARRLAEKYDAPILIHLAEAATETEFIRTKFNTTPALYLESIGLLSSRVLGAHVVHVNDDEIAILKKRDVGIAHCPSSNMKLSSGTAPVTAMLKADLRIGLGTDGAASNNDLNMWEEMDLAAKLHKLVTMNPTVVTAEEALRMATIGSARALHLEKEIGSIEAGKKADIILLDLSAPHLTPMYNLVTHLVYAAKASDVTDTIVNGKVLMRNRRLLTLDQTSVMAAARRYQKKVSDSLKSK